MISIQYTVPVENSAGLFINDPIKISLDQSIDVSYLSIDYFILYRTNNDYTEFYEQNDVVVTLEDEIINIKPVINLLSESSYLLMIIGGPSGIESTTNDFLDSNFVLKFKTGNSIRIIPDSAATINGINIFVDGGTNIPEIKQSYDLFSLSGDLTPIGIISTIPSHMSMGVNGLDKIIIKFNDTILNTSIPVNTLVGRYNGIPYDFDPFSDNDIIPTNVVIDKDSLIFTIPILSGELNNEYTFRLSPGVIQGTSKKSAMENQYEFKFYSRLSPLYATADQIISRLKGFSDNAQITISKAEIYKLILEQSLYVLNKYKFTVTPDLIPVLNRLIVCMVLKDLFTSGFVMVPNIKSRELIANKVEYYNFNTDDAKNALNDCIKDAINDATGSLGITLSSGIKSGSRMTRPTKLYEVYR